MSVRTMNSVRVMVFYDGQYFKSGGVYFRYKEQRGWFSLPQLHSFFEKYVAGKMKAPADITKVVAAHYYNGRTTTNATDGNQLEKDRDFEMALIETGIIPHYLPLRETARPGGAGDEPRYDLAQKGIDVHYAIDVLDFAHANRFDVAVLVTGDEDFVPLVRRITSLDKHALVAHFTFDGWMDSRGVRHKSTFCSGALKDAGSWTLDFNSIVRDSDWKTEVRSLFFQPKLRNDSGGNGP